jgi:hypothetical protein
VNLERALAAVGRDIDVPETPDLVPAVLARIGSRSIPAGPARRRWALAIALIVVAALAATLAIPDARSALFRFLSIGGERIEVVDSLPEVPVQEDLALTLGEEVTLEEARDASSFPLRELDESPDRVFRGDRGTVWFLYGSEERPRLLVAQSSLRLPTDEEILLKKLAGPETRVEMVDVDGSPGIFLSGESHFLFLLDEYGLVVEDSARLARDVLIWERDGIGYRLEGDIELDEALRVAESLD